MLGKSIQVHLQLTNDSLHRRNITHHGITTLRPTICHGLLRESNLDVGDIILDPMAGCGSIPIEGAISSKEREIISLFFQFCDFLQMFQLLDRILIKHIGTKYS